MQNPNSIDSLCAEVLSRVVATVTHELKNTLSIINENAGFLNDLGQMAGEDGSVPSPRVDTTTTKISHQVARSNTIIKNLNRFAHSGDTPSSEAKLFELLQLMVDLTARQAASASVTVTLQCPENITISTSLLPFESLLFYVLQSLYKHTDKGGSIVIDGELQKGQVIIKITHSTDSQAKGYRQGEVGEKEKLLAQFLQARVSAEHGAVVISLPANEKE